MSDTINLYIVGYTNPYQSNDHYYVFVSIYTRSTENDLSDAVPAK